MSLTLLLGGCNKKEEQWILKIKDNTLTTADFAHIIYTEELRGNQKSEETKKNLGIDYWSHEKEGISVRDITKNSILSNIIMYEVLSQQAALEDVTLTGDEIAESEASADSLLSNLDQETIKKYGFTREGLIRSINRTKLGDKFYLEIASKLSVSEDSIRSRLNPEDYREYITECIHMPIVKNENQQIAILSDDEIKHAQMVMIDAAEKIEAGSDFTTLLKEHDDLKHYKRSFILNDSAPEQEYKDAAAALENGQYSTIVPTTFGYYIIQMIDNNSDARYEQAVEEAIDQEIKNQFKSIYDVLLLQYGYELNMEYWDNFIIGN